MDTINDVDSLEFEMDETKYLTSSPAMVKILKEGMRAIDEGKDFEVVDIDKLWE